MRTTISLDRLHLAERDSDRYVEVQVEPEGGISITTEWNDCRLTFDEFRAKFFPEQPVVVKRYVPKKGYFTNGKIKCIEHRGDEWFYVYFDGREEPSGVDKIWGQLIEHGRIIRGEVKRYVNKVGYFVGDVKYIEDRGGDNVVSVFNGGSEVYFGRNQLDSAIADGVFIEGQVRRFKHAESKFRCGTEYVEVCPDGKVYCVRPDGSRDFFLGSGRLSALEFAEEAVRKGAWVEL